jgi:quinol monooxygenase YgiN
MEGAMFIVHVNVRVKAEAIQAFIEETRKNAASSLLEPGVKRFDVIQQQNDPTTFLLVEIYNTNLDANFHKDTTHYRVWRNAVEGMMAEPRSSIRYQNIYPSDEDWE